MHKDLEHLTSYYTRYFGSVTGERSALWLHNQIAEVGCLVASLSDNVLMSEP